jgi:hypothetical protein
MMLMEAVSVILVISFSWPLVFLAVDWFQPDLVSVHSAMESLRAKRPTFSKSFGAVKNS